MIFLTHSFNSTDSFEFFLGGRVCFFPFAPKALPLSSVFFIHPKTASSIVMSFSFSIASVDKKP